MQVEVDPGEHALPAQATHAAHPLADGPLVPDPVELVHLPPDHVADEELAGNLWRRARGDVLAVAQHGDPVRDLEHLFQPVGDEQHGHAPVAQLAGRPEELADLVLGERRGGLVHDQDLHLQRDRLRDLHRLLRGQGESSGRGTHVEPDAQARQDLLGLRVHAPPVGQQSLLAVGDEDVLGHVQVREQQRLLVDGGQPGRLRLLRVGQVDRLPLDEDLSRVALHDPGQDLDQGRLAGAVLPHQRVDLACVEPQRHVVQRLRHVEALGEVAHLQHRRAAGSGRHEAGLTATSIAPRPAGRLLRATHRCHVP